MTYSYFGFPDKNLEWCRSKHFWTSFFSPFFIGFNSEVSSSKMMKKRILVEGERAIWTLIKDLFFSVANLKWSSLVSNKLPSLFSGQIVGRHTTRGKDAIRGEKIQFFPDPLETLISIFNCRNSPLQIVFTNLHSALTFKVHSNGCSKKHPHLGETLRFEFFREVQTLIFLPGGSAKVWQKPKRTETVF